MPSVPSHMAWPNQGGKRTGRSCSGKLGAVEERRDSLGLTFPFPGKSYKARGSGMVSGQHCDFCLSRKRPLSEALLVLQPQIGLNPDSGTSFHLQRPRIQENLCRECAQRLPAASSAGLCCPHGHSWGAGDKVTFLGKWVMLLL